MIVTSMQLKISSRRDIAVLRKKSSSFEGEKDVNGAHNDTVPALRFHAEIWCQKFLVGLV
jgi:hypothetical protein